MENQVKQIEFSYKGKDYCLEFTRKSVEKMERNGFRAEDITEKPMNTLPALFAGAFIAHHPFIKRELTDEIFWNMKNRGELISNLSDMFNATLKTLIDNQEEDEGNLDWTAR